jgi:hypothetical protein
MTQALYGDNEKRSLLFRTSRRISITMPHSIAKNLEERSYIEGRSISNLAAYLLEHSLSEIKNSLP